MTTKAIDNSADVLDSRDIIARIEELEAERADLEANIEEAYADRQASLQGKDASEMAECTTAEIDAKEALRNWDEDNGDEFKAIKALAEECAGVGDWIHGSQLIRYSYFTESMKEMCEDCGYISKEFPSFIEIDWDATAENLKADYTTVYFDGVDYYVR